MGMLNLQQGLLRVAVNELMEASACPAHAAAH